MLVSVGRRCGRCPSLPGLVLGCLLTIAGSARAQGADLPPALARAGLHEVTEPDAEVKDVLEPDEAVDKDDADIDDDAPEGDFEADTAEAPDVDL